MTMPMHYHFERSVEWGHWGIIFMERQTDPIRNFGRIVSYLAFPVGVCGPADMHVDRDIPRRWLENAELPEGAQGYRL